MNGYFREVNAQNACTVDACGLQRLLIASPVNWRGGHRPLCPLCIPLLQEIALNSSCNSGTGWFHEFESDRFRATFFECSIFKHKF